MVAYHLANCAAFAKEERVEASYDCLIWTSTLAQASGHLVITGLEVHYRPPPVHTIEVSLGSTLVRPIVIV